MSSSGFSLFNLLIRWAIFLFNIRVCPAFKSILSGGMGAEVMYVRDYYVYSFLPNYFEVISIDMIYILSVKSYMRN